MLVKKCYDNELFGFSLKGAVLNIWIMIWVFLSVFILGTSLWSYQILFRQKKVWAQFAKRHNMEYIAGPLLKNPTVRGVFRDYYISLFSQEQIADEGRSKALRTIIQFDMRPGMPVEGIIASPGLRNFALSLGLPEDVVPDFPGWNKGILIRTQSKELLTPYLTQERLQTLHAMMGIKNSNLVFIFNEGESLIRFEFADPLDEIGRMERLIGKIIDASKILDITMSLKKTGSLD